MNFEEFLEPDRNKAQEGYNVEIPAETESVEEVQVEAEELDVQKAVVEELAADKAKLDETVEVLKEKVALLEKELDLSKKQASVLAEEKSNLAGECASLRLSLGAANKAREEAERKLADALEKQFDEQSRNPNALALLDRDVELPDRFPGETRDHVLEVVREARDKAEADGRIRRAQLLEGVLVANEPHGNLAKKRVALEKFFNDNSNILSGVVISELERCGISYKNGEEYLLTTEILKRTY